MSAMPPNPDVVGVARHLRSRLLDVLVWPNPKLSESSEDVTDFDNDDLGQLIMDMCWTMDSNDGVGLAAPQVGILKNIITIGLPYTYQEQGPNGPTGDQEFSDPFKRHYVLINPVIIEQADNKIQHEEGCISVPGYFEKRKRSNNIVVQYKTPRGHTREHTFAGFEAFVIQHEIDHLNGKLFIDGLSKLKKDRIKKKIRKTIGK